MAMTSSDIDDHILQLLSTGSTWPELNVNTSATTSTAGEQACLKLEDMVQAIEAAKQSCPYRKLMLEHGFNPDTGDLLLLPETYFTRPMHLPDYVRISRVAQDPICIRNGQSFLNLNKPLSSDYGTTFGIPSPLPSKDVQSSDRTREGGSSPVGDSEEQQGS